MLENTGNDGDAEKLYPVDGLPKLWRRIQEETNVRLSSLKPYNLVRVKKAVSNYERRKEEAKNNVRNNKYITKHKFEKPPIGEKVVMTADPWLAEMDVDDTPIYEETDDIQTFQDIINYDSVFETLWALFLSYAKKRNCFFFVSDSIRKLQDSR
ncbi:unnamed protein product [Caenorhabditis nigoni]